MWNKVSIYEQNNILSLKFHRFYRNNTRNKNTNPFLTVTNKMNTFYKQFYLQPSSS